MANIRSLSDLKKGGGGGGGGMPPGMGGLGGGGHGGGGHGHPPPGGGRDIDHKNVKIIKNEGHYERELSQAGNKLVVVDFTASWCGPCQFIAPHVAALSVKYPNVVFLQVDVDDLDEIAHAAKVSAMPTFHFIRHSKKIDELVGADPQKLEAMVQKHKDAGGAGPAGSSASGSGGHRLGSATDQPAQPVQPAPAADPAAVHSAAAAAAARANAAPTATSGAGGRKPADPASIAQLMDMGFDHDQCERALLEHGNSVQSALDWLLAHGSEAVSGGHVLGAKPAAAHAAPSAVAAAAAAPSASPVSTAVPASATVSSTAPETHPTPMDVSSNAPATTPGLAADDAAFAAALQAEENARIASGDTKPLTPEQLAEQKIKIQKRLEDIRRKKAEEEERLAREREMNRRKSGKEMEEARRKHDEEQARKAAEKLRREQEEDRKYKEKLLEKLKQDKLNREAAKKHAETSAGGPTPASAPASSGAATPVAPAGKKEYTECVIQIRTTDGKTLQQTFKPADTLRAVYNFCLQNGVSAPFSLLSTYPKKTYSGATLDSTTLQQADLVPRGALMIGK